MATTKSAGTVKTGRESNPQYLGVKVYGGQKVKIGSIIVRQRGTSFIPGKNIRKGKDHTLYAVKEGAVKYSTKRKRRFDGKQRTVKVVSIEE
jgi:large subunit ribosomal protein L27